VNVIVVTVVSARLRLKLKATGELFLLAAGVSGDVYSVI